MGPVGFFFDTQTLRSQTPLPPPSKNKPAFHALHFVPLQFPFIALCHPSLCPQSICRSAALPAPFHSTLDELHASRHLSVDPVRSHFLAPTPTERRLWLFERPLTSSCSVCCAVACTAMNSVRMGGEGGGGGRSGSRRGSYFWGLPLCPLVPSVHRFIAGRYRP